MTSQEKTPLHVETVDQFADRWSLSKASVYRLLSQGLPSIKVGGSRRLIADQVDAWMLERAAA